MTSTLANFLAGVALLLVVAFYPRVRSAWLPWIIGLFLHTPAKVQVALVPVANLLVPEWRSYGGKGIRNAQGAESRLVMFSKRARTPPILLMGSSYLDVTVGPVRARDLVAGEFSGIHKVDVQLGGSGPFLGSHLYSYGIRSRLYTRIGQGDPLSEQMRRLIRKQPWLKGFRPMRNIHEVKGEQCGISVHLRQSDQSFHSTFTHAGALRGLSWHQHLRGIQNGSRTGGLLYISGYFRTNLYVRLNESLRELSPNTLVMIDHGRFQADENPEALSALRDAFRTGFIDAYTCTFSQLANYCRLLDLLAADIDPTPEDLMLTVQQSHEFPSLVIARGSSPAEFVHAFALWKGDLYREAVPVRQHSAMVSRPGESSAFTAGFIRGLRLPAEGEGSDALVRRGLQEAVRYWLERCQMAGRPE